MFGSHMVLQRDRPNAIWGWAVPGTGVRVRLGDRKDTTTAGKDGRWMVRISPPPTGGPYTLDVDGPQHVHLDDILVGDVWLCCGQSNMEMGISGVNNAQQEIAGANKPSIRLFMVAKNPSPTPVQLVTGEWATCTPESVASGGWGGFSAVGYFFGRELNDQLHVPIGLVATNWGGTVAEAWTSREGLSPFKEFQPALNALRSMSNETPEQVLTKWMQASDPGSPANWSRKDFDDSAWPSVAEPRFEAVGLDKFDGVVWFRKTIELPDPLPAGPATLGLGTVDDIDTTWINGVKVGEVYGYGERTPYAIPDGTLKPGANTIVVRLLDTGGPGGLTTMDRQVLKIGDTAYPLGPNWRWAKGADLAKSPLPPLYANDPNIPSVLYNGMIAPVAPFGVKGAIWYQGESNAGRAAQYQTLLPAMIKDWRRSFGQGDFPFYIVQLANFQVRHPDPVEDAWAELREAQDIVSRKVKNSGLAVAIDIGDRNDIHPKDKQTVGHRLALQALHKTYGMPIPCSGPTFRSATVLGNAVKVRFDHTDGGLTSKGELRGFQIAGADGKFYWADARVEGDSVLVTSPRVAQPAYVRYAWDTDPEASLYNAAGLPAVPFRTDHRK
jgi:sialate O-acetylesterase